MTQRRGEDAMQIVVLPSPGEILAKDALCRDYVRSHFEAGRIAERYKQLLVG